MLWLVQAAVLAFGVPFIFSHLFKLPLDAYFVILGILSIAFFWYYASSTDFKWAESLKPGWALGIILGIFFGLAFISNSAASDSSKGLAQAMSFPVISRGVIYGLTSAILLTITPFVVVWRAFAGAAPGSFRKLAVTIVAVISIASISILYNLGLGGFDNNNLNNNVKMNMIASIPTLISGNPLAGPISNVFLQVSQNAMAQNEKVATAPRTIETAKSKTVTGGVN